MRTPYFRIAYILFLTLALLLASCQSIFPQLPTTGDSGAEQPEQSASSGPLVVVSDQPSDGSKVVVERVIIEGPGWVAIHVQKEDGSVGPEIGHMEVKVGVNENIEVPIDKSKATETMFAMLHVDAGEIGKFEFPGGADVPLVGAPEDVLRAFKVTLTAEQAVTPLIEIEDQEIVNGIVKVKRVVSDVSGWIAIHDDHGGRLGDVIGQKKIEPGVWENFEIQVNPNHFRELLYAELYIDAGESNTFEPPSEDLPDGADIPLTVDGQEVRIQFHHVGAAAHETAPPEGEAASTASPTEMAGMDHGQVEVTPGSEPAVQVVDQDVTDGLVDVAEVFSVGSGWLVIYTDEGGEPGEQLGFIGVEDGSNPNVVVQIDPAKATPTLQAILHQDTGQTGVFDFPTADPPVHVGIRMIRHIFSTSGEVAQVTEEPQATEEPASQFIVLAEDQPIRGGVVIISEVFSEGQGWIGIHISETDGSLSHTAAIGAGHLSPGINKNVPVRLTNPARATETLWAMLHKDEGEIGTYEFPGGPDVPVEEADVDPFTVLGGLENQDVHIAVTSAGDTPFLVDGAGFSLYTLSLGNCDVECQKQWLPFLATGRLVAEQGVDGQKLSVIGLGTGARQVTYGGLPLFYYINDFRPGETNGQGLDGIWFLARP